MRLVVVKRGFTCYFWVQRVQQLKFYLLASQYFTARLSFPHYISSISPLKLTSLNMRIESGDSIFYPRSLQWRPGALIICNFFCHGWNHTLLVFQIKRHLINLSWRRKSTNVRTGFYFFYFGGIMPLKGKLNIYFLARSLVWFF